MLRKSLTGSDIQFILLFTSDFAIKQHNKETKKTHLELFLFKNACINKIVQ